MDRLTEGVPRDENGEDLAWTPKIPIINTSCSLYSVYAEFYKIYSLPAASDRWRESGA